MRRRELLKGALACAGGAPQISAMAMRPERPNIVLLMSDQHRADCVGAYGNRSIHTPNLDRIGAEGVRFNCAYSTTPTCTPARSALLTGLAPWNHGMLKMISMAERYPLEMPRALRDAGYYTMGVGKMHYHPQRNGHGFHRMLLDESGREETPDFRSDYRAWFWSQTPNLDPDATGLGWNDYPAKVYALPERLHPTAWTGDTAVNFLRTYNRPEPFFLKVSWERPHSPYDPPERLMRTYQDAEIPGASGGNWAGKYASRSWAKDDIWHGDLGAAVVRRSRQGYYGSVSFIDEQVGRILEALEKRGWLESTLIIHTSDHGDMLGDHHLWRKSYGYEPSARVPMLMRWPEGLVAAKRGQVLNQPVELRDILPTFLESAGQPAREELDGRSLLPLVRGQSDGWRKFIDLEHGVCYDVTNQWTGLTDGRIKYLFHSYAGEEQLFDLERDPHEINDLASDPAHEQQLREWRARMVAHLEPRGEPFVKAGKLLARPFDVSTSPNFPRRKAQTAK